MDLIRSQLEGLERKLKDMENRNADMTAKYNTLLLTNKKGMCSIKSRKESNSNVYTYSDKKEHRLSSLRSLYSSDSK